MNFQLKNLLAFFVLFTVIWSAYVLFAWKFEWVSPELRPWLRIIIWTLPVVPWVLWSRQEKPLHWLGLLPLTRANIAISLISFGLILGWNILRVNMLDEPTGRLAKMALNAHFWVFIGVAVEELVFRGLVQAKLSEHLPSFWTIFITSVAFWLIHVPGWLILSLWPGIAVAFSVYLIGLICCFLRYKFKNLWPAVTAHWANNLGSFL